ncbi:MAG: protein translocase subunit SecF, partial [Pseudomonadota bacterium]
MRETLGADVVFDRREAVSPTVSGELVQRGVTAVGLATAMMLAYIAFRFQFQWGAGAVLGVIHDTVITIGLVALFQFSFDLNVVAAILTVIGYSVNDTVVVYDRIRENLRKYKKMPLAELIDLSLNETLTRTVVTGGTSILALAALVAFGGEVLRGFCFAIMFGIIVGTYSSLFVAAPFLLLTGVKRDWAKVKGAAPVGA